MNEDKITIRVNLVDRFYPLNIYKNEEEKIRQAAKKINDTVMQYKKIYADKDEQDFLAMAALHFVAKAIENEKKYDMTPVIENLKDITQELGEYISGESKNVL
jgi:hypothetical protein